MKHNIRIQMLITTLEDAKYRNQDIHITFIDFRNAFGYIDHARILTIMEDLGFLLDVIEIISNIYADSTTSCYNN